MTVKEIQGKLKTLLADRPIDARLKARILAVTDLRPLRVIAHIVEHGSVSTEELTDIYGYNQPPRAARDVRERGIPLTTKPGQTKNGRRMAIYELGDSDDIGGEKAGRTLFAKTVKDDLVKRFDGRCAICCGRFGARMLQVDHRVPYEIAGELGEEEQDHTTLMPLCSSCNRSKSWECEHCPNWTKGDVKLCQSCFWAAPVNYAHSATVAMRRETITWTGSEVEFYDKLRGRAGRTGRRVGDVIKEIVREAGRKV